MLQLVINGNNTYQEPQTSDTGDLWFPAMSANVAFMNAHVHDGVKANYNPVVTQTISSGSWAAAPAGGGLYRQLVTMPTGLTCAAFQFQFALSNGNRVELSVEPQSTNTYYLYINDASQTITAIYSS